MERAENHVLRSGQTCSSSSWMSGDNNREPGKQPDRRQTRAPCSEKRSFLLRRSKGRTDDHKRK
ncbi:hypothetical protein P7K49_013037, partial [Saguinus oedipus]